MALDQLATRMRAATADLLAWEQADRHIVRGLAWTAAFVLGAKAVAAVKEIAVAARFGVGNEVDAYQLVMSVASWPVAVATSVFTVIVLPLHLRLQARDPPSAARLQRELLGWTILAGVALTALLAWLTPLLIDWLTPPAAMALRRQALAMLPVMLCIVAPGMVAALHSAWIMAEGRQVGTLLEGMPSLTLLVLLLAWPAPGAMTLAWGIALGISVQAACAALVVARGGRLVRPAFGFGPAGWPLLATGGGLTLLSAMLSTGAGVVEQFIGAHLDTGSLAALGYSSRIVSLVSALGALAVTRATLPVFSSASHGLTPAWPLVRRWFVRMAVAGAGASAIVWMFARPIVRLLFERGAFGVDDVTSVAAVLRFASLQFPIYFAGVVLNAYAASRHRYGVLLASALVLCVVRPLAGWWWAHLGGAPGLAASMTAAYAGAVATVWWRMHPRKARP